MNCSVNSWWEWGAGGLLRAQVLDRSFRRLIVLQSYHQGGASASHPRGDTGPKQKHLSFALTRCSLFPLERATWCSQVVSSAFQAPQLGS